jgi:hypothetical protein
MVAMVVMVAMAMVAITRGGVRKTYMVEDRQALAGWAVGGGGRGLWGEMSAPCRLSRD